MSYPESLRGSPGFKRLWRKGRCGVMCTRCTARKSSRNITVDWVLRHSTREHMLYHFSVKALRKILFSPHPSPKEVFARR